MARGWDFEYGTTCEEFAFRRCPCGGVYLDPRPAAAALAQIYPADYYAYDFAAKLRPLVARVKGATERAKARAYLPHLRPGAHILDVGCGDGHLLALVRAEAPFPLELDGVELTAEAAAEATRHGIRLHEGRVEEVVLPPDAYDLIVVNQLIEHVADPAAVLRRIRAALRPGGHLFLETPNLDSLDARLFRRRYWGGYHLPRHFHLFDRHTLPRLVAAASLDTVAMRPLVCPQFWIISLSNWLAAHGRRAAAERWVSPFSPFWLIPATAIEVVQARLWWTSNLQLVARRPA
jgi:2-polyprenyl-3-methyl-5-hydroxy-6-metoxy-1,4-benzoquinol methylase